MFVTLQTIVFTTMICGTPSSPSWSSRDIGKRFLMQNLLMGRKLYLRKSHRPAVLFLSNFFYTLHLTKVLYCSNERLFFFPPFTPNSSTDSQLKLWNVNKPYCLRSFKGHINEKNFVGLASNGDYVACGECEAHSPFLSSPELRQKTCTKGPAGTGISATGRQRPWHQPKCRSFLLD